jgi:hypothetical protein
VSFKKMLGALKAAEVRETIDFASEATQSGRLLQ